MNTVSNRLSRYTPAIFACTLANLLLAELAATAALTWPAQPLLAPMTLATIHLVTLGWLTLVMFGALFQFVPVISNRPLPSQRAVLVMLIAFELGLAAMVAGFIGASGRLGALLPVGGALVLVAVLIGIANLLGPLARSARDSLPARFMLAALGFLLTALLLGLGFALALRVPSTAPRLAPLLARGLAAHLAAGIGGWFTLTAIGVSYKLLPMFMLAPEERGLLGEIVFATTIAGFGLNLAGAVLAVWPATFIGAILQNAGWALAGFGVVLYLADVVRLYRTRRRHALELHNRAVRAAFVALAVLLVTALAWRSGYAPAAPVVVLALGAWLSGLALTQLYKIVAFLSWLTNFGDKLGRAGVPRVQDLVDERRARIGFAMFFAGAALMVVAAFAPSADGFRSSAGLSLIATLTLTVEYRMAWVRARIVAGAIEFSRGSGVARRIGRGAAPGR